MRPPDFHVATYKIIKFTRFQAAQILPAISWDPAAPKKKARSVYTPRAFQVFRRINCQAKRYRVVLPLLPE